MANNKKEMVLDFIPFNYRREGEKELYLAVLFNHKAISPTEVLDMIKTGKIISAPDNRFIITYLSQAMALLEIDQLNKSTDKEENKKELLIDYIPFSGKRENDTEVTWLSVLFNHNAISREEVEEMVRTGEIIAAPNSKFIITYLTQVLALLDLPLPEEFRAKEEVLNIEIGNDGAKLV